MSPMYVLRDPAIWKDPEAFNPDRFINPATKEISDKYYVPFSRGPRACVGQNLAYAELYVVLASVIRRFPNLKLYDTKPEDVVAIHDFFGGMWRYEEGMSGLQVKG